MKKIIFILTLSVAWTSCIKINLFEKQSIVPDQNWYYNYVPEFSFQIDDTLPVYHVYIILRHTDLYQFKNIWLRVGFRPPTDSMQYQNINLILATDAKGWEGSGMDDIYEVRKNISGNGFSFKNPGKYTFSVAQIMRENPLPHILNVGVRVEKAPD